MNILNTDYAPKNIAPVFEVCYFNFVQFSQYSSFTFLFIVLLSCTLYTVHCTVYSVQCTHHTLYIVQCIWHIVHCTVYSVQCTHHTLYIVQCILHIVQRTITFTLLELKPNERHFNSIRFGIFNISEAL